MTLREEIRTHPECQAAIAARDIDAIAAIVSVGRTAVQKITTNQALTWAASGPIIKIRAASIDSENLACASCLSFIYALSTGAGFDMADPAMQGLFAAWEAIGVITADEHAALITMATQPAPVSRMNVAAALFNDDGSEK